MTNKNLDSQESGMFPAIFKQFFLLSNSLLKMLSSIEEGYKPQLFLTCSVHYTWTPIQAMCGC